MQRLTMLILVASLALAPTATAAELTELLPARVLGYAELHGLDALPGKLLGLPYWRSADAPKGLAEELFTTALGELGKELGNRLERAQIEKIWSQARTLRFCLVDVNLRSELPVLLARIEMTSTADLKAFVDGPLAKVFGKPVALGAHSVHRLEVDRNVHTYVHIGETAVTLSVDQRTLKGVLDGDAPDVALAQSKRFAAVRARYGKLPFWAYVDIGRILDKTEDALDRRSRQEYDKVDSVLDFRGMKAIGVGSRLEGGSAEGAPLDATLWVKPNNPMYAAVRSGKTDGTLLQYLPADATLYAVLGRFDDATGTWGRIKALAQGIEKQFGEDDFSRDLRQFRQELGVSVEQIVGALGPEVLLTHPMYQNRMDDDAFVLVTKIRNRAAFDRLLAAIKASPEMARMLARKPLKPFSHRGWTGEHMDRRQGLAYAISDDQLIVTGDHRVLPMVIDAKATGVSAYTKLKLAHQVAGAHKLLLLVPGLAGELERDLMPLGELVKADSAIVVRSLETDGELRATCNVSAQAMFGVLSMVLWRSEQMSRHAWPCESNLEAIGRALRTFVQNNQKMPATLAELKLPAGKLVCPLDKDKGVTSSYVYVPMAANNGRVPHGAVGYCPHVKGHGPIVLYSGGYAWRSGLSSFRRDKAAMDERKAEAGGK